LDAPKFQRFVLKLKDLAVLAFGSPERKGRFWHSVAKRKAKRYGGFHLYTQHMVWKKQPFFRDAYEKTRDVAGIPDPRCFVLQSCLRSIARLEGDVAECGVRQGRSTIFMLTADLRDRQYHLFDSFEGLSEPSSEDRMHNGAQGWEKGALATEESVARANLRDFKNVNFHVGWIPETLEQVSDRKFAFVHIDVDLYEPTVSSLAFFHDRLLPGGMIVCDDYGSARCPGARKAFDEFFAGRPEGIIELPTGQALVTKSA
jgi:hypothetical protein